MCARTTVCSDLIVRPCPAFRMQARGTPEGSHKISNVTGAQSRRDVVKPWLQRQVRELADVVVLKLSNEEFIPSRNVFWKLIYP
jgi:hypothetical protein